MAVVIEMQGANFLLGRHGRLSRRGPHRDEAAGHRVAPGDSASVCANPQPAGCVAGKRGNPIVGQTACHAALTNRVLPCVAVVAIQPIFRAEPQKPLAILHDGHHAALRQTCIGAQVSEMHRLSGRCGSHAAQP